MEEKGKIKIKVCGLADAENLKEVLALEPDLIGLIFYPPSPRYVKARLQPEDIKSVLSGITRVGVFVNMEKDRILDEASAYGLKMVQLHGEEKPELCEQLSSEGIEVMKAFNLHDKFDFHILKDYEKVCRYFLFDTPTLSRGGSGRKFNWDLLTSVQPDYPFFLSGGIGPGDASGIRSIDHPGFAGADVNSRFEISPGIKDTGKLKKFINEIRR